MLVTIAVLLALVLRREVAAPAPAAPQPKAAAVAPTEPPRAPPTQPNIVTPSASAVIVTTPDAVEVVENNRVLGVTPMTLAIDPVALTRQPRLIVLRKEGYQSQSIELGPVPAGTVLQRTLLRNGVKAAPPKRPASPAGKPLDIRTTR